MSIQDLESLKNEVNFQMVSKLKRTKNPTKVLINDNLKKNLKDRFRLNGRYRLASEFIQDFDILTKRSMALNSFCNVENGSFQLMVNNNRRANYFEVENGKMVLFIKFFFLMQII